MHKHIRIFRTSLTLLSPHKCLQNCHHWAHSHESNFQSHKSWTIQFCSGGLVKVFPESNLQTVQNTAIYLCAHYQNKSHPISHESHHFTCPGFPPPITSSEHLLQCSWCCKCKELLLMPCHPWCQQLLPPCITKLQHHPQLLHQKSPVHAPRCHQAGSHRPSRIKGGSPASHTMCAQ